LITTLKLFENNRDDNNTKEEILNLVYKYVRLFYNNTINKQYKFSVIVHNNHYFVGFISIKKKKEFLEIVFDPNDKFKEPLELLINWLSKDNIKFWYEYKYNNKNNSTSTILTLYYYTKKEIIDSINRLIKSEDLQIILNSKKYNL